MSSAGLGRKVSRDDRDRRFSVARLPTTVMARTWTSRGVLDQGSTSQCVAYSGVKYLTSSPVLNRPKERPEDIYRSCLKIDEWIGEDWDGGTSVRALFKVLKGLGYVTEYRWAFDAETAINHILTRGPVVLGTEWFMSMFTGDRHGYIEPEGEMVGGHAYLAIGANRRRKNPDGTTGAVRIINSWGANWNDEGRAWLTTQHLDRLIKAEGEAAVATEVRL